MSRCICASVRHALLLSKTRIALLKMGRRGRNRAWGTQDQRVLRVVLEKAICAAVTSNESTK